MLKNEGMSCGDRKSTRLCLTRFPYAYPKRLSLPLRSKSLTHYTKGTQSPISEKRIRLLLLVRIRFQVLFHSPTGVLFAFPSRYWFTIGRQRVFSLGGWSPHLQTGYHVSCPTYHKPSSTLCFSYTGLSPTMADLSKAVLLNRSAKECWLLRVRSPLLTESQLISFPPAT